MVHDASPTKPRPPGPSNKAQSETLMSRQHRLSVNSLGDTPASGPSGDEDMVSSGAGHNTPQPRNGPQTPMGPPQGGNNSQTGAPGASQPPESGPGMVVETETVPSVPTLAVSTAGSLRVKRSQDTVPLRHVPHMNGGTGTSTSSTRKRSLRMGQGSKADIFAARVASAVDEANNNSSDSDETFVYDRPGPRDRSRDREDESSSDLPRDLNRDASAALRRPFYRTTSTTSLGQQPQIPQQQQQQQQQQQPQPQQPSAIRPFVAYNPRRPDSQRTKNTYLQRWRTVPGHAATSLDDEDDEDDDDVPIRTSTPRGRAVSGQRMRLYAPSRNSIDRIPGSTAGYTTFGDGASPHDYAPIKQFETPLVVRVTLWMVTLLIGTLALVFLVGLVLIASRPLKDLDVITLSDVFTSDQELVFSMVLRAKNPGLLTVNIERAELDVFATTQYASGSSNHADDDDDQDDPPRKARTILLGTVSELESPVSFGGSIFNPQSEWQTASAKLLGPAANGTDTSLWSHIIAHPFDLTVKGTLRYKLWMHGEVRASLSAAAPVTPPLLVEQNLI